MIANALAVPTTHPDADVWTERLIENGYTIIPDAIDKSILDRFCTDLEPAFAQAAFGTGLFYGETTKRFGRLLARSPHAEALAGHPLILAIMRNVLLHESCNTILLNISQAVEICPGAPVQYPHRDQDMFGGEKGGQEYLVNVMWALDDFTQTNGATRLWKGSNHLDPQAGLPDDQAQPAVMRRGSALLFLGSTLHSGGANHSSRSRRGVIMSYCQGWLRPWENPWLAYPPEVAKTFSSEIAALVGYCQHLPQLGNFEGQCPSILLKDNVPAFPSFADALTAEQIEWVADYQRQHQPSLAA